MICTLLARRLLRDMGGCALVLALGASGAAAQARWP